MAMEAERQYDVAERKQDEMRQKYGTNVQRN
jgi:hypothetical protein